MKLPKKIAKEIWYWAVDEISPMSMEDGDYSPKDSWRVPLTKTELKAAMRLTDQRLAGHNWAVDWTFKEMRETDKIKDQAEVLRKHSRKLVQDALDHAIRDVK